MHTHLRVDQADKWAEFISVVLVIYSVEFAEVQELNEGPFVHEI